MPFCFRELKSRNKMTLEVIFMFLEPFKYFLAGKLFNFNNPSDEENTVCMDVTSKT